MGERKIENCPFCGGTAKIYIYDSELADETKYYVCCTRCGAESGHQNKEEKVIAAWNRRKYRL